MGHVSWRPSLGFRIGLAGLALTVTILVAAGLAAASQDESTPVSATPSATPERDREENRPSRPRDSFAREAPDGDPGYEGSAPGERDNSASSSSGGESTDPASVGNGAVVTSGTTPTPTVGQGASATPAAIAADAGTELTMAALSVVSRIENQFGIAIQVDGQDWGSDGEDQVRNLTSVESALYDLPAEVLDETRGSPGGTLTFLSNEHGRTLDGWQPYGNRAANFYTNEDQGQAGRHPANLVVLQTGSSAHTIAHEVVHAYQLRDTAPGSFVSALLTGEMKSFMAASGWTQLASDEVILATGGDSWDAVNGLFDYKGPALLYTNQFGGTSELYAPNPLEAFAEAAALYYTHDSTTLPGWSDLWAWFDSNLG